jgi:hypothetical protein
VAAHAVSVPEGPTVTLMPGSSFYLRVSIGERGEVKVTIV